MFFLFMYSHFVDSIDYIHLHNITKFQKKKNKFVNLNIFFLNKIIEIDQSRIEKKNKFVDSFV